MLRGEAMRVTVKDIANHLGIAQGTVSKALMGKSGVSQKTREMVLKAAEKLGYKVNRVAQTLSRSTIHIGVIAAKEWIEYNGQITEGIEEEAENLSDYNVETEFLWVENPMSDTEVEAAIRTLKERKVSAVLFCLATVEKYIRALQPLVSDGIPVVVVGAGVECKGKLPAVRLDAHTAGRLAAEFMCHLVPEDKATVIFTGNKDILEHSDKVRGYQEEMNDQGRKVIGVFETQDDPDLAYALTQNVLGRHTNLGGIYVATGNSISVCDYIEQQGASGTIKVIGTDIYPETVAKMHKGTMQGIIFQNPKKQGRIAIKTVYKWLSERKAAPEEVLIAPQLVLRSNLNDVFE